MFISNATENFSEAISPRLTNFWSQCSSAFRHDPRHFSRPGLSLLSLVSLGFSFQLKSNATRVVQHRTLPRGLHASTPRGIHIYIFPCLVCFRIPQHFLCLGVSFCMSIDCLSLRSSYLDVAFYLIRSTVWSRERRLTGVTAPVVAATQRAFDSCQILVLTSRLGSLHDRMSLVLLRTCSEVCCEL